ncbi:Gst [Afipia sp. P52-10]|jgi:glutathione S-transferase|uniref:glutathione transferase GstA n=1 Tax=Afipia sp. P52-10 TaxID=1429916 RepID=UPI0003DF3C9B|nr:glutathione transferase GstA [Afipia sp. P52-10]ETR77213.1 Gst [Afipia sp. P52-10]
MKLYYSPGACSLSPHIALAEAGLNADLVKVNIREKKTESGDDYLKVAPKGQVPVLSIDGGATLTEGPAIVQYIADKAPDKKLAPANGTLERYQLQEWLNLITSELHKAFSPLFNPAMSDETKAFFRDKISKTLTYVGEQLAGKDYLMGSQFTVADGYLFTILRWAVAMKFDLAQFPNLKAYYDRVGARPKVKEAMLAEGLIKA